MSFTNFQLDCLESHNQYRAEHEVPDLVLSEELCAVSQEWADYIANINCMQHRTNSGYGENIYSMWTSDRNHEVQGRDPVDSWYEEIKDYTFGVEPSTLKSGHFTQVVWKDSTELGVGIAKSNEGSVYVVANYSPPGNFTGRYSDNVPPVGGF